MPTPTTTTTSSKTTTTNEPLITNEETNCSRTQLKHSLSSLFRHRGISENDLVVPAIRLVDR